MVVPLGTVGIIPAYMVNRPPKEAKLKLTVWLPTSTVENVERVRGYLSRNQYIWKSVDRMIAQEGKEKLAISV